MQTPLELVTTGINLLYATSRVEKKKKQLRSSSEALHRYTRNATAMRQTETENAQEMQVVSKLPYIDHPSARGQEVRRNNNVNS